MFGGAHDRHTGTWHFLVTGLYLPQTWSILSAGLGLIQLGPLSILPTAWLTVGAQCLGKAETSSLALCNLLFAA